MSLLAPITIDPPHAQEASVFTGIIEGLGIVVDVARHEDSAVLTINAGDVVADLGPGGSLAVDGVCLTSVVEDENGAAAEAGRFVAEVMGETLRLTGLGALTPGDPVNLERCTVAGGRLDGHVVQGHVDGLGEVIARTDHAEWTTLRIGIPARLAPFTAVKGSIALNGVSLTLTAVSAPALAEAWVEVGLIPATLTHTTFGGIRTGDPVNVEVDVIAKYTARLLSFAPATAPTTDRGVDHD